jgi:RHS repeat-associated protein
VALTAPANGATVNAPVTLSATASATEGYAVSKVEFFDGSTLIGTDTTSPYSISWNNAPAGSHTLTAKATATKSGNPNQTATSSPVNITVNAPPVATITSPTEGATFDGPATITVTINATDSNGSITRVDVSWYDQEVMDQGSMTLTQPPYTFDVTITPLDLQVEYNTYTFSALATDNGGAWTFSNEVHVMVGPSVTLTSPINGATFAAPAAITLQASVGQRYANLQKIEFYQGSTLIGQLNNPSEPYRFNWENVPAGTYSLTAKAISMFGWVRTSAPINVTVTGTSKLYFIHADHLNTPRLVADATGTTVWRWDQQEPFGVNAPDENPSGLGAFDLPLRLPGQYFDKETNLHYNHFRDYDPSIGRYGESDPIGLRGGLNTFAYVNNRPVSLVDPMGLKARVCCKRIPGLPAYHCFIDEVSDSKCGPCLSITRTIGLQGPRPIGTSKYPDAGEIKTNDLFDNPKDSDCGDWNEDCGVSACIDAEKSFYPERSVYNWFFGPNSNTFAGTVARACKLSQPDGPWAFRGWHGAPATPK